MGISKWCLYKTLVMFNRNLTSDICTGHSLVIFCGNLKKTSNSKLYWYTSTKEAPNHCYSESKLLFTHVSSCFRCRALSSNSFSFSSNRCCRLSCRALRVIAWFGGENVATLLLPFIFKFCVDIIHKLKTSWCNLIMIFTIHKTELNNNFYCCCFAYRLQLISKEQSISNKNGELWQGYPSNHSLFLCHNR